MTDAPKIWRGGVSVGSSRVCDECSTSADTLYEIGISARGERGQWACRGCVIDPVRQIGAIDRRGDTLRGARIARELDAAIAIATHLEIARRASMAEQCPGIDYGEPLVPLPLPAPYWHVLSALDRCRRVDAEFSTVVTELRDRYEQAVFFSPKQTLLIQWRLSENGIALDPGNFVVSTRSEKEIAQLRGFDDWRRKKIASFLSWQQRGRFGF
ncbi:MAG: hypothetical protein ABR920_13785 [Terriglobales bacterium]